MSEKSLMRRGTRKLTVFQGEVDHAFRVERVERDLKAPVACKKGCAHCCHQMVTLYVPEAVAIFESIKDDPFMVRKVSQWADAQALLIIRDRITAAEWFRRDTRCMFLRDDSTCGVYERRPFACRALMALFTADDCRPGAVRVVQRPDTRPALLIYNAKMLRLADEMGVPPGITPLPVAMQWASILWKEGRDGLRRRLAGTPFYDPVASTIYWASIVEAEAKHPGAEP